MISGAIQKCGSRAGFACLCFGLVAGLLQGQTDGSWVGTWACSPQLAEPSNQAPAPGFADSTLRQIVHVSVGGDRLRVRISNAFSSQPLTITSVHLAESVEGSKIRIESDKAVTFHGEATVTIPAGALMVSDPAPFAVAPLSNIAVSMHVATAMAQITAHPGSRETSYLKAGDSVGAAELTGAAKTVHWYFLNGLDVSGSRSSTAVIALGDSITDGHGATTDGNDRWTDDFSDRLHTNKKTSNIGVLNEGIGGNRLLRDGLGPNALARFDRDVLAQTGVRWVIVLEGINDIGTLPAEEKPVLAEAMIAAYEQMIIRAHAHGIRIYGATILPYEGAFYFHPAGEVIRQKVNAWIRTSGRFDAVIDWDVVMRDPQQPSHLASAVDSGDHLHPSAAGYKKMAEAISLKMFEAH